jgi:uncharacterized protein (DUF3820 family)
MSELNELNDESLMPLGVHKGKRMEEVPASYLIWYRENAKSPNKPLMDYILDNWQVLQKQKNER